MTKNHNESYPYPIGPYTETEQKERDSAGLDLAYLEKSGDSIEAGLPTVLGVKLGGSAVTGARMRKLRRPLDEEDVLDFGIPFSAPDAVINVATESEHRNLFRIHTVKDDEKDPDNDDFHLIVRQPGSSAELSTPELRELRAVFPDSKDSGRSER